MTLCSIAANSYKRAVVREDRPYAGVRMPSNVNER